MWDKFFYSVIKNKIMNAFLYILYSLQFQRWLFAKEAYVSRGDVQVKEL